VLSPHDVGGAYRENATVSGPRRLGDISIGDSAAVQAQIRRDWLGGMEAAYNGTSVPWGIVSLADVFRSAARVGPILQAWQGDFVRISGGTRLSLQVGWPGMHGVLIRGHVVTSELLIYIWQRGRTIASVDVTGPSGKVPLALLMKLALAQDARISPV